MEWVRGRNRKRSEGDVREVAHIAWPIVVSMLSYTAMGVSDTLLVGWLGITELAAVGLATTAVFVVNSAFMGTLHGLKVVAAQATGRGDGDRAIAAGWHGVILGVPFGLIVIGLSFFDAELFALMGGPQHVQLAAREYFVVRMLGAPFLYSFIAMNDYFQGIGDTRTPMKVNLLVNGLNIGLDVLLIFGLGPFPALGIAGAAWASVIATVIGLLVLGRFFWLRVGGFSQYDSALMGDILRLGVPIGVRYGLEVGGFAVFTAVVARMGEAELAANQIAIKIISLSFLPGHGIGEAATVLTGQYLGAKNRDGVRRSFHSALILSVVLMGFFGLIFWAFPEALIRFFHDDPQVMVVAVQLLYLAAIFQVFDAVAMTAAGALNGIGDTKFTMWVSIVGSWFVLVPLTWLFGIVLEFGARGAWMALTAEIIVLAVVLTWRFQSRDWVADLA